MEAGLWCQGAGALVAAELAELPLSPEAPGRGFRFSCWGGGTLCRGPRGPLLLQTHRLRSEARGKA